MSPALAPVTAPRRHPRHAPAPAAVPRRDHLRLVEPPARSPRVTPTAAPRVSRRAALLIGGAVLFAVLFAVAVLQTQNVAGQMHLDRVQQDISDRQAQAQALRLEAAELAAPERIVSEAQRLGLSTPAGGPTFVNQIPSEDVPVAPGATSVDPSQMAAPEAEVSLDETAAGPVDAVLTP